MTSKTAFNGVVVLTFALLIVKILSALYRVPYQNILGDEGLYAYQQIYPIVALGVVLSSNAIPSAYSQLVSHTNVTAFTFKRLNRVLTLIGLGISILLFLSARFIAYSMGDVMLTPMLRSASVCFVVVGILGVLRGHFQSRFQMSIPAYSQVIEQIVRVSGIGIVIILFDNLDGSIYEAGMWAIMASTIGFIVATLFLWWKYPMPKSKARASLPWRQFFSAVIIFAISHLIVILWQVVDSFTVVNALRHGAQVAFRHAIEQKGIYDRGASFIQMGLIVTTTFCFVLIPLLTDTQKQGNTTKMNSYANASLKMTMMMSSASSIGLINLLPLLNRVFFKSDALTYTLSLYMLTVIGVSLIMMYIALLEVQHQFKTIFSALFLGIVSKILLNISLIPIFEIFGASLATVGSLLIFVIVLHLKVLKQYRLDALSLFYLKLIIALIVMTLLVQFGLYLMQSHTRLGGLFELLIGALLGVVGVIAVTIMLDILSEEEWMHLPFGDKVYRMKKGRK
ncbi:polysaccharide biosynthesis protein [Staphylococcus felis]|uniref:polysaccharide biosynthesis protein n=1 Tax=Staphylococcus felis TaxID=46127 RepID=UPI000E24D127|nr:polysaccharide biosynthesis protein [Staphylococcus felis]REH77089.1 polysaccharide biosynthesis protein [Staphylococcus felis]REH97752.1 polysaccharide biosynthesis protein [Staphylococcus felis]REI11624.1 polysaccharide biosynthesis protein [Staphylococcus felis]UXR86607.1 polysaccharide biosynthesis protein [Staphylococcus felis]